MVFKYLKSGVNVNDDDFNTIYPPPIRVAAEFHFTPVDVAKFAAQVLVNRPGMRVLDIGSGAGKFCMIGATCTNGHFTGVEQRETLCQLSNQLAEGYMLSNVSFVHSNITDIGFDGFDAFYFFNSFYENINRDNPIDSSVKLDRRRYDEYSLCVRQKLDAMPLGTRLATYFSYLDEVPGSYMVRMTYFNGYLKLWEKTI